MIEIRLRTDDFRRWLLSAQDEMIRGARTELQRAISVAYRHALASPLFKDRTHTLRQSIVRFQSGPDRGGIAATAKHALFVEVDTKPHEIRPRRVGMVSSRRSPGRAGNLPTLLRFQINGRWVSKDLVKHPGTKGTHFMRLAGEAGEAYLHDALERVILRAFR